MVVQTLTANGRVVTAVKDLDVTAQEVRPIVTFQIVATKIMVVFFHFKSGNEGMATSALQNAVIQYLKLTGNKTDVPTLWIGDYNRALLDPLNAVFKNVNVLISGGGIAKWSLDKAVITGTWGDTKVAAKEVSRSGDNQHIGISVSFSY